MGFLPPGPPAALQLPYFCLLPVCLLEILPRGGNFFSPSLQFHVFFFFIFLNLTLKWG